MSPAPNYGRRLAANLARLRKQHRYTQQQLAGMVGVKRALVGAWEEGRCTPRLAQLVKLRRVFGVSLDELIAEPVTN